MRPPIKPGHVAFHDGTQIAYDVPANTLDPRYVDCTQHRVACDCREALLREDLAEINAELKDLRATFMRFLNGHPGGCMCTGCQIGREIWPRFRYLINEAMPGPMEKTNV